VANSTTIREEVRTGKAGRPFGTGKAQRSLADIDVALEQGAYVLQREVHRMWASQNGRGAEAADITALTADELETLVKTVRALADVQSAVDDAKERLRQKIDGLSDSALYERTMKELNALGKKMGRPELVYAAPEGAVT
jgi:hypothetical protein